MKCFILTVFMAASVAAASAGTLSVRILDDAGSPVAARVYLTDSHGRAYSVPGAVRYLSSFDKAGREQHFVPPDGAFTIDLPAGRYLLEIERGKEFLPVRWPFTMPGESRLEKTFPLKRWIRMADRGWYSGDMHVHATLRDVATLMQAEDLNVALPLSRWGGLSGKAPREDPELNTCLKKADSAGAVRVRDDRWYTCLNEELESDASALLVSHLGRTPLDLEYPLGQFGERARQRHAVVDSEMATSLELPAVAAVGGCDLVGVVNAHFWRSGCYLDPWGAWPDGVARRYPQTCSGFAQAGFEMYYALLDMGFPLKVSAGNAYGVHPGPMGWSRIYAHTHERFDPESWFAAVKGGRSFVTTGPMLLLKANGLEPGEEYRGERFPLAVEVQLTLLSPAPLAAAEIVANGAIYPVKLAPDNEDPYAFRGKTRLSLKTSAWVAARWIGGPDTRLGVAHTSPIYFWNGQEPIPAPLAEARFLESRVKTLMREVERTQQRADGAASPFAADSPALRRRTLDYMQRALEVYERTIRQATSGSGD